MMMKLRKSPMHPQQLTTSEEATVKLLTINNRSSGGSLIPVYVIYIFISFICFVLCVLLCVFVFQILNKGDWRSLGYDLMKLLTIEGTSRGLSASSKFYRCLAREGRASRGSRNSEHRVETFQSLIILQHETLLLCHVSEQ